MSGAFNNQIPGATIGGPQGFSGGGFFAGTLPVGGAFRLYNLGDDLATNFERLNIDWSANVARILAQAGGTGTVRTISINNVSFAIIGGTGCLIAGGNGTNTPISTLDCNGSFGKAITTVAVDTAIGLTVSTILVDATGGNKIITLPAASTCNRRIYTIKKIDVSVNTVTIQANGAELIDGANTQVLATQYLARQIQSDGVAWWVIGHNH